MPVPVPANLPIPFANTGPKNAIPVTVNPTPGGATLQTGFPPITMTPIASGGIPPYGQDMNGILFEVSAHTVFLNAGGQYVFDAALAAAITGYNLGAVLQRSDGTGFWLNTVAGNATDPDAGGAGWVPVENYGITALAGLTNVNVTLTPLQAAKSIITLAGTLTGNVQVILPPTLSQWLVVNNTTGAFSVTVKTAAGTGVIIPQLGPNGPTAVWGDGTNIYAAVAPAVPFVPAVTAITGLTNADVVLTAGQYANPVITLAGTLTGNLNIIFPTTIQNWTVANNTTGAFTITCKTVSGTGAIVPQNGSVAAAEIWGDGVNIYSTTPQLVGIALVMTNADVILTPDQYQANSILITGALTANVNLVFPANRAKTWWIRNNTTGNFTVTAKTTGVGTVVVLPQYSTGSIDGTLICGAGGASLVRVTPSHGVTSIALSNANVVLTSDQWVNKSIVLTGTLTANVELIFPTGYSDIWSISNRTTGAFTITAKTAAGTGPLVPQGGNNDCTVVASDGTNMQKEPTGSSGSGRLVAVQIFTANGTYTRSAGAVDAIIEIVGGGGGGSGSQLTGAGTVSVGGSGGAGAYARHRIAGIGTGLSVVVGAGGTAGSAGVNNAGNGGNSSFAGLFTVQGGAGGPYLSAGPQPTSAPFVLPGGVGGTVSGGTPNQIVAKGAPGGLSFTTSGAGTQAASGPGGSGPWGGGAVGVVAVNPTFNPTGVDATQGPGSGGSGAANSVSQVGANGGAGFRGQVIVWEYS